MLPRILLAIAICVLVGVGAFPQTRSSRRAAKPAVKSPPPAETEAILPVLPEPTPPPTPEPSPPEEVQDAETIKIDTNLVVVPVIATSVEGNYIPDLRQEEFTVSEDGDKQEVAFFAAVSAPFHVVLLLDTSASTKEKLSSIRSAAIAFVEQLQAADRVKVISFDNEVRELSDFTSNRATLRNAINKTTAGQGTKLYDAFDLALSFARTVKGRKAIVLFSDGVDWHSDRATFDDTLYHLDEEGVIVYPIRFETRAESERIAREAAGESTPNLPTIDAIRRTPSGTTAPTFPSDDPSTVPTGGQRPKTGPFGLPTAADILRGRRERDGDVERDRLPPGSEPTGRLPGDPTSRDPSRPSDRSRRRDDSVSTMLDALYLKADSYLMELAKKSGGRLLRADTIASLPDAFANIAAELRIQYAIGYYPTNKARDGRYRKIKVGSNRKGVVVRARPGYRAPAGG